LALLAVGALLAGIVFKHSFFGTGYEHFWGALFMRPAATRSCTICTTCPVGEVRLAVRDDDAWLSWLALDVYPLADTAKRSPPSSIGPLPVPAQQVVLRRALRLDLRAPGKWLGRCSGRRVTAKIIDGSAPTASPRASSTHTNRVVKLQTGFVYHYAFAMLIGVAALITWSMSLRRRSSLMIDWPILSIVTFLPLVGCRCLSS
jgi:NADH-quinone oxidoreductase subunit L